MSRSPARHSHDIFPKLRNRGLYLRAHLFVGTNRDIGKTGETQYSRCRG